jgi:hypothetical protein
MFFPHYFSVYLGKTIICDMTGIKVQITAFIDGGFPGWVRCTFTDIHGKQWFVEEKVPIVTDASIDENTAYPVNGVLAGQIEKTTVNDKNQEIVTINTNIPWAIASEDGTTLFEVFGNQIVEWSDHQPDGSVKLAHDRQMENNIRKLVSNAKAILTNQIGLPLGVRKMTRIAHWTTPTLNMVDLSIFTQFDQAIVGCPVGSERLLWDKDALKRQDEVIDGAITRYRSEIIDKCFEIIERCDT